MPRSCRPRRRWHPTPPTSWNSTSSGSTPCIAPSTSSKRAKHPQRSVAHHGEVAPRSINSRISRVRAVRRTDVAGLGLVVVDRYWFVDVAGLGSWWWTGTGSWTWPGSGSWWWTGTGSRTCSGWCVVEGILVHAVGQRRSPGWRPGRSRLRALEGQRPAVDIVALGARRRSSNGSRGVHGSSPSVMSPAVPAAHSNPGGRARSCGVPARRQCPGEQRSAAPKPLSMPTTVTPVAHDVSMASRAVTPSSAAP